MFIELHSACILRRCRLLLLFSCASSLSFFISVICIRQIDPNQRKKKAKVNNLNVMQINWYSFQRSLLSCTQYTWIIPAERMVVVAFTSPAVVIFIIKRAADEHQSNKWELNRKKWMFTYKFKQMRAHTHIRSHAKDSSAHYFIQMLITHEYLSPERKKK